MPSESERLSEHFGVKFSGHDAQRIQQCADQLGWGDAKVIRTLVLRALPALEAQAKGTAELLKG